MTTISLTGRITTSDSFGRIRLLLVDYLDTWNRQDYSHEYIRRVIPYNSRYKMPYKFVNEVFTAEDGVYGEVLLTIPRNSSRATDKNTWLDRATELRNCEVRIEAKINRYNFTSKAEHNFGKKIAGSSLTIKSIEELERRTN